MEQHPIPQQISSYEFKLVGEMTLKQFFKAAAGLALAALIYSTKLIFIVKWPLIILSAAAGLALAFVPFQDRPLELWLVAFLRSIYAPTIYLYKKRRIDNWLDLDLNKQKEEEGGETEIYDTAVPVYQKNNHQVRDLLRRITFQRQGQVLQGNVVNEEEKKVKTKEEEITFELPPEPAIKKEEVPAPIKPTTASVQPQEDWRNQKVNLDLKKEKLEATGEAVFGDIPMPSAPNVPNVIIGMVTDKKGKLIEGAIVEIQDEAGNPTRVLKTNPLGQFKTSTPLLNGKYLIIIEKEGLTFDRISVTLNGEILQPLRIVPNN